MHSRLLWTTAGERCFAVVLEPGEEAKAALTHFALDRCLSGASLTASGAFERATLAWFDLRTQSYRPIEINQPCKAISLTGGFWGGPDGNCRDGRHILHLHAVMLLYDGTIRGGHLLKAIVRPTLEATIIETSEHLRRRERSDPGMALINLA